MLIAGRGIRGQLDWTLFTVVALIAVLGVVNQYSVSSAVSVDLSELYLQQIYWLTLGAIAAVASAAIDYRVFERYAWAAYSVGIALLVLVFLLGISLRGSTRWFNIGLFAVQPSELMKLLLIVALAKYLHNDPKRGGRTLQDLVVPATIAFVPMVLILLQPDLGTALMLGFVFGSVMLLTKLRWRSVVALAIGFALSIPITYWYLLQNYQRERVDAFFDPHNHSLDAGWHTEQSMVAIGNGGMWGQGFMKGLQNQSGFLPDQYSDFPFSVWAEEQGLVGSLVLLGLYVFLVIWGIKIASQAKDRFGAVLAIGVTAMIFWQTVINLAMVSGLLPVVGMTLPLFSYGGSSMVTMLIGVGLLMNVSIRRFHF